MKYNYKIIVDSCCELRDEYINDERFSTVPLAIEVGNETIVDSAALNRDVLIEKIENASEYPKTAAASIDFFMEAYKAEVDHIYVVTISSQMSDCYNNALIAANRFEEMNGRELNIHIIDSESASCGELQIVEQLIKYEEKGLPFDEIVGRIEVFRNSIHTYCVLDTIEMFKKTGFYKGIRALVENTLNVKPILESIRGSICKLDEEIGMTKALNKMVDLIVEDLHGSKERILMISHCNAPERAEAVKRMILERAEFVKVFIVNMHGISSMYTEEGGIIVTV